MFSALRRSWNSYRRPKRAKRLITGASDHPEAANYFIGNDIQYFGISTAISLGVTKIQRVLKKTPFWTNTMLFSHSLGQNKTFPAPLGMSQLQQLLALRSTLNIESC